ncbi:E2F4 factor, partial [Polyodon spathula]|nr:E2F4 factor [Polyodon spathula]
MHLNLTSHPLAVGDTLLAIRAPSGTQLEVPVPEGVLNGQKKYQIHLKSTLGPIEVLLVNKDTASSLPVVLPVPPPEDLVQSLPTAATPATPKQPTLSSQPSSPQPTLQPSTPVSASQAAHQITPLPVASPACTAVHTVPAPEAPSSGLDLAPPTTDTPNTNQTASLDTQPLQSSASLDSSAALPASSMSFEPIKSDPLELLDFPKELSEMFDPTKECMSADLLEELMSSEVFAPLLRLSPPPGDHDYIYNLDESEGLCDLFDVPILNL